MPTTQRPPAAYDEPDPSPTVGQAVLAVAAFWGLVLIGAGGLIAVLAYAVSMLTR